MNNAADIQRLLQDALAHHNAGRFAEAEAGYHAMLRHDPDHPDALHLLGVLAHIRGDHQRAAGLIRRALVLLPNFPDAHMNLGNALSALGDAPGARAAYGRALALRPDFFLAHQNFADLLNKAGQHPQAESHARQAIRLAPPGGEERAWLLLWQALRGQGRQREAVAAMQQAIARRPGIPAMLCDLATTLAEAGDTEAALPLHRQAIAMEPGNAMLHMGLAASLNLMGDVAAAEAPLRRVVERAPGFIPGWLTLGWTLRGLGRFDEARACFTRVLDIDPNQPEAHWNLSLLGRAQKADSAKEADLRALMERRELSLFQRVSAGFALGKTLDDQDRCDEAFDVLARANAMFHEDLRALGRAFSPARFSAEIDGLIGQFPAAAFAAHKESGLASDLPVFIVGMPRSGTTLVEQIAASHSLVHGAGELRDIMTMATVLEDHARQTGPSGRWDPSVTQPLARAHLERLAKLGGDAVRVIDKTPDNVILLGTIAMLFPGARVIICRRDARDVCLSHFFQLFTDGNPFSYDLAECGWRARETERLMDHWRQVLPIRCMELQYETLVENLEREARRMIDFLGLEWEPACLDFHRNERAIATPNMWGVRQPIYNRSVGRWRQYERHLGPLLAALAGQRPPG